MRPLRPGGRQWLPVRITVRCSGCSATRPTVIPHSKVTWTPETPQPCTTAHGNVFSQIRSQQTRFQHGYSGRGPSPPDPNSNTQPSPSDSDHGPHKEYFQTPGYSPKPDLTPYNRARTGLAAGPNYVAGQPAAFQTGGGYSSNQQAFPTQPQDAASRRGSILGRLLRSVFYTVFFFGAGTAAGTALITWEYLSPMFEEGSEEEAEMIEDILETLEDSLLVEGLREEGWREVELAAPMLDHRRSPGRTMAADMNGSDGGAGEVQGRAQGIGMGRNMLSQTLTGSKGVVGPKMFYHPEMKYSMMVFFTGFGIEGWPDIVHGGVVSTLLEEAVMQHLGWHYRGDFEKVLDMGINIDFKYPVRPGEIYAVLVPPANVEPVAPSEGTLPGLSSGMSSVKIVSLFMQLEGAPRVSVTANNRPTGNTLEHTVDIPSRSKEGPSINAVAELTLKVTSKTQNNTNLWDSITEANAKFGGSPKEDSVEED